MSTNDTRTRVAVEGFASGNEMLVNSDGSINVNVVATDSSAQADDAAFTPATSVVQVMGAFADETGPDSVDEGDAGAVRMTLTRALHTNPRNASGTEIFTATTPGRVGIESTAIDDYETVAASQTAQALGATGATGDFLMGVLVVPASVSPGNVIILDNAISITVFAGGTNSVNSLVPFYIPLGLTSVSGAWKITTGANVSCIGIGKFT